jgi:xylulokinase
MSDVVVGLDIGTSSTKAIATDADGVVLAQVTAAHDVMIPAPGHVEQDAEAIWWHEACGVLRELSAQLSADGFHVAALAVSGLGPCVLICDAAMQPLHNAILYGIDTRAETQIDELDRRFGEEAILARGGSRLTSQAAGAKLAWLRENQPENWSRAAGFYSASSFLIGRLSGEYILDHHSASQFSPLYDLDAGDWASDWAAAVVGELPLPRLVWSDEICGRLHVAGASATGLPVGTPILGGTIDAWAEAHSVGVRDPGDMLLMYGSTMFLIAPVPAGGARHRGLWRTASLCCGSQTLAAGMATSGLLTTWLSDLTGRPIEELSSQAAEVAPGADGLLMLPYFSGERSPLFDPGARGVALGLHLGHGPAHLMRAIYEGTAFSVRHVLDEFNRVGGAGAEAPDWRITVAGGGTKSRLWSQLVSDITGYSQHVPAQTIGASYGDALLAATAIGMVDDGADWTKIQAVIEPRRELVSEYERRFATYLELYPATRGLLDELAAQSHGAIHADV